MPWIRCASCGMNISIDAMGTPYEEEIGCPKCRTNMQVYAKFGKKTTLSPMNKLGDILLGG